MSGFRLAAISVPALLLLVTAGCGNSSDAGVGGGEVAKAEFIEKADAICVQTDKAQKEGQRAFLQKYPDADSSTPWEEKFVVEVGLPPVQTAAERLGALEVPAGDEEKVDAIVEGMEDATKEARADPSTLLKRGSAGPFTEVFKLARKYGFKACATPL